MIKNAKFWTSLLPLLGLAGVRSLLGDILGEIQTKSGGM
jgi:hypothetical protein